MTNGYFFFGEDDFLIEEAVKAIVHTHSGFDIVHLDSQCPADTLANHFTSMSLFSSASLFLWKNPGFLSSTLSDSEWHDMQALLESALSSPNILICYMAGKTVDGRKKTVTWLKKNTQSQEFLAFKDWERDKVMAWISNRIAQLKLTSEADAIEALEEICGTNLRQAASELDTLSVYLGERTHITRADVRALSGGLQKTIFDLSEAMKSGRTSEIVATARYLLENGQDPNALAGLLISNYRTYLQILELDKRGKSAADIAAHLKRKPFFIQKLLSDIKKHYTISSLTNAFAAMNQFDIDLKTGKIQANVGLELALVSIHSPQAYRNN